MQRAGAEGDGAGAGGGAEGWGEGVEAAVAGEDDAGAAHDGEVFGGGVGGLADALGENGDGEGLAFDEFLEDEPAGGLAEHGSEVLEGEELDGAAGAA